MWWHNIATGQLCLTLCLHAGADQSQGVTGKLTAGAGHGAAGQQNQHARVGAVGAVLLQVVVLQRLRKEGKKNKTRKDQQDVLF